MLSVDPKTGKPKKDYSLKELTNLSKLLRSYIITAISLAGSGHTGGCMSAADIATALYFNIANHDPSNPGWEDRDRMIQPKHRTDYQHFVFDAAESYKEWKKNDAD